MSVSSQIARSGPFLLTALPQVIPVGFQFQLSTDLVLFLIRAGSTPTDPYPILAINSDYTVTGGGYNALLDMQSGSVTIKTGGANSVVAGDTIVIMRNVPETQLTSFRSTGLLTSAMIERGMDKLTTIDQELQEVIGRSLRFEPGEMIDGTMLKSARANQVPAFDSDGNLIFLPQSAVPSNLNIATVTPTGTTTARKLADLFADVINVKDFGAAGDGATNDWAPFLAAVATGKSIYLPQGTYKIIVPFAYAGLTLSAAQQIYGDGGGRSILQVYDSGQSLSVFVVAAANCRLMDFSVQNYATFAIAVGVTLNNGANNFVMQGMGWTCRATAGATMHAIKLADNATVSNVQLHGNFFYQHNYGLFTTNSWTGIASSWRVTRNLFSSSYADDLAFNGPSGTWRDLVVANNNFTSNQYVGGAAGFAIDLAPALDVTIVGNTFYSYTQEAVHLENGCVNVAITGNTFRLCPLGILVLATNKNTKDIVINGNNLNGAASVSVTPGGTSYGIQLVDAGGNNYPLRVRVTDNVLTNYDIALVAGNGAATFAISQNTAYGCGLGFSGYATPLVKDNLFQNCIYAFGFGATQGICGFNKLVDCTNLLYSTTGKNTFVGLGIVTSATSILDTVTASIPVFPTPTAMYVESFGLSQAGANSVSRSSLLVYGGFAETSHYGASVGTIGDGTHAISGGNLVFKVLNSTGGTISAFTEHTFNGAITFN